MSDDVDPDKGVLQLQQNTISVEILIHITQQKQQAKKQSIGEGKRRKTIQNRRIEIATSEPQSSLMCKYRMSSNIISGNDKCY